MPKTYAKKSSNELRGRRVHKARNGYLHVISPASASEIRKALGIKQSEIDSMLRAFDAVGVKY